MARIYPSAEIILVDDVSCAREIEESLGADGGLLVVSEGARLLPLPTLKRLVNDPGSTFVSETRPKFTNPNKALRCVKVRHAEVGGVTGDVFSFWLVSPQEETQTPTPVVTNIRRDISFDLKAGVFGTKHEPPPEETRGRWQARWYGRLL